MIRVTIGQRPPCIVLTMPNRAEPYIIRDEKEATQFVLDLNVAFGRAFPSPTKFERPPRAEVPDGR